MEKRIQKKLLSYRKERGFTLRQLAEKAGCTPSFISQVERGFTVPSLSMVGKLAAALNVPVIDLFSEEPEADQEGGYVSKAKRKIINYPDGKVSSQLLAKRISTKKMEPLISIISPGGTSDEAERMIHPSGTEEFVLVMQGEIYFYINDKEIRLLTGDTLSFNGVLPHRWVNKSNKATEVLFVFSPPIW